MAHSVLHEEESLAPPGGGRDGEKHPIGGDEEKLAGT